MTISGSKSRVLASHGGIDWQLGADHGNERTLQSGARSTANVLFSLPAGYCSIAGASTWILDPTIPTPSLRIDPRRALRRRKSDFSTASAVRA